jgi:hypothetical protein
MVYRRAAVEKRGRRIGAHRSPKPKNELSHAPIRVAVCGGDIVLGHPVDEDSSQRLVLAVVRRGIGIQEETAAMFVIHDQPLKC